MLSLPRMRMPQFRRITSQGRFVPQIDGLRFVAIASVLLCHIYEVLVTGPILSWQNNPDLPKRGVELFFAISGFILGVPFASRFLCNAPPVKLKQYFLRRLTRLEPPYILNLMLMSADNLFIAHRTFADVLPHLLASCFYLQNQVWGAFINPINGVTWSLEVEVQFYILAPLLAGMFAVRNRIARRGLLLLLMAVAGLVSNYYFPHLYVKLSILYYFAFFLAGFLVCDLYLTRKDWTPSWRWDVVALAGWSLFLYLGRASGHFWSPFLLVVVCVTAFRGRIFSAFFSNPVITSIGGMCYSIYLFHSFVISAVRHFIKPFHIGEGKWFYFPVQAAIIIPFVLLFCGTFFLLVERPCMDRQWPQKLWAYLQLRLGKTAAA